MEKNNVEKRDETISSFLPLPLLFDLACSNTFFFHLEYANNGAKIKVKTQSGKQYVPNLPCMETIEHILVHNF